VFENVQVAVLARRGETFNLFRPARTMAVAETRQILDSVGLGEKTDRTCGMLSHGDQKVLEIAIALGSRPRLLILDEPTAGMSPEETAQTLALMKRLVAEFGLTILFCEHDMGMVFSIADRIMVMQQGQTIAEDTPEAVRSNPRVQEAYLGESAPC
jgi:branched-chain amino acid transport system ATP-binding protein